MQKGCDRNRKRSKRRAIYCPIHACYLDSVSPKYPLFADRAGQLQNRGLNRKSALMLIASQTAVPLQGEWLEAFWCEQCQETNWYHMSRQTDEQAYTVRLAPAGLWQQAQGVTSPYGNPSVSEFTRRHSHILNYGSSYNYR